MTYRATGTFDRHRFCPVHGFPLRAWHRAGKLECPVRPCPYVEVHGCEVTADPCRCHQVDTAFDVPDEMSAEDRARVLDIMSRRKIP